MDSKYNIIVAVKNAIIEFAIDAQHIYSESYEHIKNVPINIKEKFEKLSGSISYMKSRRLEALNDTFPETS